MMMKWRFEDSGLLSGAANMQRDEELARQLVQGTGISTLRVYGWKPPTVSLGWNQLLDSVDVERAASAGIDIVRRSTGGRAILHSEELTYAVVMPSNGESIAAVYARVSRALVGALRLLNIDASLEASSPHFPSLYRSKSSMACFSSSARYEVKVNGRKLIGSAQRRYRRDDGEEIVLQHGSILLGPDHKRIAHFLKWKDEADRLRLVRELDEKTIDLSSVGSGEIGYSDLADAIRRACETEWEIQFLAQDGEVRQLWVTSAGITV